MSIRFSADKTALRRSTNLPSSHAAFTICACFKLESPSTAREATLIYTQSTSGGHSETLQLNPSTGSALRASDSWWSNYSADVATVPNGGTSGQNWFFGALVGSASGTGGLTAYHKPIGTGSISSQSVANSPGTAAFEALQIGDASFGTTYWFNGYVAHLKIYDRALSESELIAEAGSGTPVSSTNLISYHSFSNATLSTALIPDTGTGTFSVFTGDPATNTDMPVFSTTPVLTLTDTLPSQGSVAIPSAPTLSTATITSSKDVTLVYTSPGGVISGFRAFAQKSGDAPFEIGTAAPSILSISASGLTPNTAYTFYVTAYNDSGQSSPSNTLVRTTYKKKVRVPKVQKSISGTTGVRLLAFTGPAPGERIGQKIAETTTLTIDAPVFDATEGDSVCIVTGDISAVFNDVVSTVSNGEPVFVILDKESANLTTGLRPATIVEEP